MVLFEGCGGSTAGLHAAGYSTVVTDRPAPTVGTQVASQWVLEGAPSVKLSIDELAQLQGFPPDWKWTGTKTQQARMVGNAVPAALAAAVASVNRPITLERAA